MHFRRNDSCDGGFEELQPIDKNLHYDFNYQNSVYFANEITILPVSTHSIMLCIIYTCIIIILYSFINRVMCYY